MPFIKLTVIILDNVRRITPLAYLSAGVPARGIKGSWQDLEGENPRQGSRARAFVCTRTRATKSRQTNCSHILFPDALEL